MEEEFLPDPIKQISIEQEIQQNKESPVIYSPVLRGSVKLPADAHIKGGQTAYNTGQGFFLGYDGTAYKFSIGDPDGDYLIWDGAGLTSNKFGTLAVVVSDNLRNSNDTERTTGATSATKVKEIL